MNNCLKIHINHDGVGPTAIMLRSTAASSSWRSLVIAGKQASEITSAALRVNDWELVLIFFRCVEGRPHQPHQPALSSREILMLLWMRLSFIRKSHALSNLCLIVMCETLRVFMSHNSFHVSLSDSVLDTKKTSGESVKFDLPNYLVVNYCRLWSVMVWHFWQL